MINGDQLPTIKATRVELRWLTERDIDALFAIFADPQVVRYWSSPPLKDRPAAEALLEEIRDCFRRKNLFQWGIARSSDDVVLGTCTLAHVDSDSLRAEVGFALGRDHWRQGYAGEALSALFGFAFDRLGLRRIEADVDPRNEASIRVLEKLGFKREGYLRERWLVAGEVQDAVFYGLLRGEWPPR